jgi:methionyl-tRNA formyltransferase
MRIEFISQDDPLYLLPFFDEFLRHYSEQFDIRHIGLCRVMGKRSRRKMLGELQCLYGTGGLVRLAGEAAIAKMLGRGNKERTAEKFYSMPQICRAYGIPYTLVEDPNAAVYVEEVKSRAPDVMVSVACPHILKAPFLAVPPLGCVNIHHAPLPRFKGMMPTFWQLYHGEKSVGVTIHYMAAKVDEGAILLQESLAVEPGEVLDRLIRRSKRHGAHAMARVLKDLETGKAVARPMDQSGSTYFTFPTKTEIREFYRRGHRAI